MPKTEQEYEMIRAESKNNIISAAIEVFAKKGYAATSTADIAKTANVSVGLMYRYFRSKQELFESITRFAVQGLIEVTERLKEEGNPKEILLGVCSELLSEMENDEFIYINMMMTQGIMSEDNSICKEIIDHDKKMFEAAENLIRKGQDERLFSDGDPASKSALLFSYIQGIALMRFIFKYNFTMPTLSDVTAFLLK